ncbi:MAG: hypothetical protein ABIG60_03900 [Patescibacteria group bacterium]
MADKNKNNNSNDYPDDLDIANDLSEEFSDSQELAKPEKIKAKKKEELELLDYENDEEKEKEAEVNDESVVITKSKIVIIKKLVENIKENNEQLGRLLSNLVTDEEEERINIGQLGEKEEDEEEELEGSKVIEGVFDGENMIGPDGKQYSVPANYASKSKLVEGDILKLTITKNGTFVYKQIGPIDRDRVIGQLEKNNEGNFFVVSTDPLSGAGQKKWRVLSASVTYYKGKVGDEVIILIPKTGESKWAAVENIVRAKE